MMAPAAGELLIEDWLTQRLPTDTSVELTNITRQYGTLVLAGPDARKVLAKLTDSDLSNEGFPWFTGQEIEVAGAPVRALRMNFVGELGWELHHPIEHQAALYDALIDAGKEWDIKDFGLRAMDSMRLEKGYPMWGHDLITEFTALEANLGWFVKLDKGEFEGRAALALQKEQGVETKLVLLEIDTTDVDAATGMEPVYQDGNVVGQVSSGGYGHRVQKSLALAYVNTDAIGADLTVKILGNHYPAKATKGCVYDPKGELLKSDA